MSFGGFDLDGLLDRAEDAVAYALHRMQETNPELHAEATAQLASGDMQIRLVVEMMQPRCEAMIILATDEGPPRSFRFTPSGELH